MARDHARMQLAIYDDPDYLSLNHLDQWVYESLLKSRDMSYCGVLPLLPSRVARLAKGLSERKVAASIVTLTEARYLVTDTDTAETCVRTYVRHDGILKQPNLIRAMNKAHVRIHSEAIREAVRIEVGKGLRDTYPEGFGEGIAKALREGFAEGFAGPIREGYANSPSPFPLPPSLRTRDGMASSLSNARVRDDAMPLGTR